MVWTVLYEFVIYPVIQNSLPSIIRRIGIIFFITALSIVFLILKVVHYYHSDLMAVCFIIDILHSVSKGLFTMLLFSTCWSLFVLNLHKRIVWRVYDSCVVFIIYYQL